MAKKWGQPASAAGTTWRLAVGAEFSRVRSQPEHESALESLAYETYSHDSQQRRISIALQKETQIHARQIKKKG